MDIAGCRNLELKVKVEDVEFESVISPSDKTVFWGNPCLVLADGRELPLSGLPLEYENTDTGNGIGVDYQGGKEAFFVTVLEPYEEEPQIVSVEQHLLVTDMLEGIPEVQLKESNPV